MVFFRLVAINSLLIRRYNDLSMGRYFVHDGALKSKGRVW